MNALRSGLGLALLLLAACSGDAPASRDEQRPSDDDHGATSTCIDNIDCPFGQACDGGVCTTAIPEAVNDDGCMSEADCGEGLACAVSTGKCVAVPDNPSPVADPSVACLTGEERVCGSKIGQCRYGVQRCVDGNWDECAGATGPVDELCNGLDDDCDGVIGDSERDLDSDGTLGCAGDCGPLDPTVSPEANEVCDGKDNDCDASTDEDPLALCDDGIYCNGAETCSAAGACVAGAAIACGHLSTTCADGVCNEVADACEARLKFDGTPCDDGLFCTDDTTCSAGTCGAGTPRDCSSLDELCVRGACDEVQNTCVPEPRSDGTTCEAFSYCYQGESCLDGVCQGGVLRSCSGAGSCTIGTCNPVSDRCEGTPVADDTACDDGVFCTVSDKCAGGVCGGAPRDCSATGDTCNRGVCETATDECRPQPYADNRSCDDGSFCSVNDTCRVNGTCSGSARDCSAANTTCATGACNESNDSCQPVPSNEGGGCNDGLYCSVNDVCVAGSCQGAARSCASLNNACNLGLCNEVGDACERSPRADGTVCDDGQFCTVGDSCTIGVCASGGPRDCSVVDDLPCFSGVCNETQNACEPQETGMCMCDPGVDADFDGSNSCNDCDDSNGAVRPGATERCNGLDDDCDGLIDETFDMDGDTYSVCAVRPELRDCDDTRPLVNPGASEACGPAGTGNGLDDNCNGYIDEGCAPCDSNDTDGDGRSQCQGDCAPNDGEIAPGRTEACDGKDNDCNVFTTENCGVSDPCNWPTGADTCRSDLLCACVVNNQGDCSSTYICTSLCNTSVTGPVGDGCDDGQTCYYDLLSNANVHGCAEQQVTLGLKVGGVACNVDSECRSGNCAMYPFTGPGQKEYCYDYCGSDAYCPASGTVCKPIRGSSIDGRCWPVGRPGLGSKTVGQACASDLECNHGMCTTVDGGTTKVCTEPCCTDTDCGAGFTCSLRGDTVAGTRATIPPGASTCTTSANCAAGMVCAVDENNNRFCAWPLVETIPVCVPDSAGQGTRQAGAACAQNADCASNFCERSLSVCVEVCCSDSTCPTGLSCEQQILQTSTSSSLVVARACVNQSSDDIFLRK